MQKHPGSFLEGFTQTQISTLAVKDKLLVAGGFQGELICKVCIFYSACSVYFVALWLACSLYFEGQFFD